MYSHEFQHRAWQIVTRIFVCDVCGISLQGCKFSDFFLISDFLEGKRKVTVESNNNVSVFPSNPEHDKIYLGFLDVMPPLWACYATWAGHVDITQDSIISDDRYYLFELCLAPDPKPVVTCR